jgi:hypothetical protein
MYITVYLDKNKVIVNKVYYSNAVIDYVNDWYKLDRELELPTPDEYSVDVKIIKTF